MKRDIKNRLERLAQAVKPNLQNGGIAVVERRDGITTWPGVGGGRVLTDAELEALSAAGYYVIVLNYGDKEDEI